MRPRLVVATSSEGKLREIREALGRLDIELLSAKDAGVTSFPNENGGSYEENALLKAGYATLESGLPALADDSGLEVDALDGAPGIFSARYGGQLSDGERLAFLLQEMRDVPKAARGANFTCCLVIATPSGEVKPFYGESRGEILQGPRGETALATIRSSSVTNSARASRRRPATRNSWSATGARPSANSSSGPSRPKARTPSPSRAPAAAKRARCAWARHSSA